MRRRINSSRLKLNSASSSVVIMAQCVVLTTLELAEFKLQTREGTQGSPKSYTDDSETPASKLTLEFYLAIVQHI